MGSRPGGELSAIRVGIVRMGNCPDEVSSWTGAVLDLSSPGGESSGWELSSGHWAVILEPKE